MHWCLQQLILTIARLACVVGSLSERANWIDCLPCPTDPGNRVSLSYSLFTNCLLARQRFLSSTDDSVKNTFTLYGTMYVVWRISYFEKQKDCLVEEQNERAAVCVDRTHDLQISDD